MESAGGASVRSGDVLPENQDLGFLLPPLSTFLSDYGWYLLFLCAGVYLLIQHLRQNWSASSSVSVEHQDPVLVSERREAVEASRRRMQEELNIRALEYKEKQQRLEQEKTREKHHKWESMKEGKSYKGNADVAQDTEASSSSSSAAPLRSNREKKTLRSSGYNPLSGDGGTCSWRPGRRGPSSGG